MRPDFQAMNDPRAVAGPLGRVDVRLKLIGAAGYVVAVVLTPVGAWPLVAVEASALGLLIAIGRVPIRPLLARWLGFVGLVAFLAAMVAQAHPSRPSLGWGAVWTSIVVRNSLALLALTTVAASTPYPALLNALGRLGIPPVLIGTLHFMGRYAHVLGDELARMTVARRARTFRRRGRLGWSTLSGLVGMLLVRSFERGERVHAAMVARGWDGTLRGLDLGPDDARPGR